MGWLGGWRHCNTIPVGPQAGAGADYVKYFKVYYGAGVNGTEALTGGHTGVTAAKIYCGGACKTDFSDLRWTAPDGTTLYDYHLDSKVDGTWALFGVEVADDCSVDAVTVCIYWDNYYAVSLSSAAATYRRVISSGVVLSLPMNEGADADVFDYSGNGNNGTAAGTAWSVTGKFGNGLVFTAGDKVDCGNDASLNLQDGLSAVVYVNQASVGEVADQTIISRGYAGNGSYYFGLTSRKHHGYADDEGYFNVGSDQLTLDAEHCVVFQIKSGANNVKFYADGAQYDVSYTATADLAGASAFNLWIGRDSKDNDYPFIGTISGVFLATGLGADDYAAFNSYYPQCSSANLGSLYLRSFVNPEPAFGAWTGETDSTSGDEQYYYYTDSLYLTPEQESKLPTLQQQLRNRKQTAVLADPSKIDWSLEAVRSEALGKFADKVLSEARKVGTLKEKN